MIYSIFVNAGLENIARQEIIARFGDTKQFKIVTRKPQRIIFQYMGNPKDVLSLRTAESLFLVIKHFTNMTRSRRSLTSIRNSLNRQNFSQAITACRQVGLSVRKRVSFRVISRMSGYRNFQKRDLQQIVERSLIDKGWTLSHSETGIDVWAEIHGEDGYISVRLSRPDMSQRSYKQVQVPHTLKPTVAHSMVMLSKPHPDDIFLDPMCGAGTILLERAFSGRYRYLIGGDLSEEALRATQKNFGRQHQPRQFLHWDSEVLPIQPNSVDKIVCNLPIDGIGTTNTEIYNHYHCFIKQFEDVIKPGGKMVLLSMQPAPLNRVLKNQDKLKTRQQVGINLNGKRGRIFVVHC